MSKESTRLSEKEYKKNFKKNRKLHRRALQQALEIRRFEIDLYWKRAAYFWAFIGASFVGFAAFLGEDDGGYPLTLMSCIGLVFSVAWHCVNKGSKYWQENWENHVELLEDEILGPLYKTLTKRPDDITGQTTKEKIKDFLTAPKPYSVSKINQLVSTYTVIVWISLLIFSLWPNCTEFEFDFPRIFMVATAVLTCLSFMVAGKSHLKSHTPEAWLRKSTIDEPNQKPIEEV